jgi:hypothetical protein
MEPYVQKWPRRIAMEDWLTLAHPGTPPALPSITQDGREICSFAIMPVETGGILVLCYAAHGTEVVPVGETRAIEATAIVLGANADELTFLPVAIRP